MLFAECPGCKESKPLGDFGPDARKRNGRKTRCRPCDRVWQYGWREANSERWATIQRRYNKEKRPAVRREYNLHRYGLDSEQYEKLLADQGGVCAICAGPPVGRGERFHVDHDHACCPRTRSSVSCGACIRGLLCGNCNTMLGLAKDDPSRLQAAINYLKEA